MSDSVPTDNPTLASSKKRNCQPLDFEQQTNLIRKLIWLYLILWLFEGGLRRWVFPGLATPLLLIRDPLVVIIYFVAAYKNLFPINNFIYTGLILAILTIVNAMVIGHGNLTVALYGVHCDFLHVPLIFIMARVLRQNDLLVMAKVAMWITIPYTALLVAQFYAPQDAWVNRGVGGSLEGAGFTGALDRFRPPGTFSFITGVAQVYTIFTACWFALVLARKAPTWLMVASGVAILVAVPLSISRGLFFSVCMVAIVGVAALFVVGRLSSRVILQAALAAIVLPFLAMKLSVFHDGMEAFGSRWDSTLETGGGVQGAVVDRVVDGFTEPFKGVQVLGLGTGFSTNVGQKMLTGEQGFGASEGEWGRLLYDNGFILGSLLVGYRIVLSCFVVLVAFRAWQRRSAFGLIFASAAFMPLLTGQWGQASSLGGTIIEAGLTLATSGMGAGTAKLGKNKSSASAKLRRDKKVSGRKLEVGKAKAAPFAVTAQLKTVEPKSVVSNQ